MFARIPLFVLLLLYTGFASANSTLELRQGEFIASSADTPPAPDAAWRPQTLPDIWRNSHDDGIENGWYRFHFAAPLDNTRVQAVYLPKLGMNAAVWINGMKIGDGGRMVEPLSRNWNRPMLFPLPHGVLKQGGNTLHIQLRGNAYTQPFLFPPSIGPEMSLRQSYERTIFLNITLNQTATILIAAIGALMLSLWWRRKQETAYGYFGISALVWAAQSTNQYVHNIALTTAQWETLVNASFQVFAALLLASLLRFIDVWKNSYRPWFLALLIAAPLTLAVVPAQHFLQVTAFWHLATVAATVFTLTLTFKAALAGNREARLLVATLALVVLFALHDWALHSAHLWKKYAGSALGGDITLLQYSAPLLFMAIGWIMTSRYLRTLDAFEQLNSELDQRVKDKEAALEASYARMRQLEMEQAVATERERIHSDLHDDVGAKLLSLVYRAETSENAELARSALQDLRDVVSQTSENTGLEELAADWRAECDKRLSEAQIHLDWHETGDLASVQLTQPQVLNLTRILREAVSNIIRHSGAQAGMVRLSCTRDHLSLGISDNGKNCPPTMTPGRGLRNMAARAQKLGGNLIHYTPPSGGHGVRMEMPLNDASH